MRVDSILSQLLGQAAQALPMEDPRVRKCVHYLSQLQGQLFGPWAQVGRSGITCTVRYRRPDGVFIGCNEPAISGCMVCGQGVCLDHSLVAATGEVVCRGCVDTMRRQVYGTGPRPQPGPEPPTSSRGVDMDDEYEGYEDRRERRKHLRRLGLRGYPSANEIRAAYRKAAAKAHPDRHPSHKRDVANRKFVRLGESKDWLLDHLDEEAA